MKIFSLVTKLKWKHLICQFSIDNLSLWQNLSLILIESRVLPLNHFNFITIMKKIYENY